MISETQTDKKKVNRWTFHVFVIFTVLVVQPTTWDPSLNLKWSSAGVWKRSSLHQMVSLLPESIVDSIRAALLTRFEDVTPGFWDRTQASKERERMHFIFWGCFRASWLEGRPDGGLCDLFELANVLTWHLQKSNTSTKTDNCWMGIKVWWRLEIIPTNANWQMTEISSNMPRDIKMGVIQLNWLKISSFCKDHPSASLLIPAVTLKENYE